MAEPCLTLPLFLCSGTGPGTPRVPSKDLLNYMEHGCKHGIPSVHRWLTGNARELSGEPVEVSSSVSLYLPGKVKSGFESTALAKPTVLCSWCQKETESQILKAGTEYIYKGKQTKTWN